MRTKPSALALSSHASQPRACDAPYALEDAGASMRSVVAVGVEARRWGGREGRDRACVLYASCARSLPASVTTTQRSLFSVHALAHTHTHTHTHTRAARADVCKGALASCAGHRGRGQPHGGYHICDELMIQPASQLAQAWHQLRRATPCDRLFFGHPRGLNYGAPSPCCCYRPPCAAGVGSACCGSTGDAITGRQDQACCRVDVGEPVLCTCRWG